MTYPVRKIRYKDDRLRSAMRGEEYLLLDGGMGTMLQRAGLADVAEPPDLLNLSAGSAIENIQRLYVEAGCDVVTTNTFNSNPRKLDGKADVAKMYEAAAQIARDAGARYVAGDIGPTGALLEPIGTFSFDDAYRQFALQAKAAEAAGCDLVLIETMTDLLEAKAAALAALENTSLPVLASMSFEGGGRTFLGTTPAIAAATLGALGVEAVGANCSVGPDEMADAVGQMRRRAKCAILAQPNAGIPHMSDGKTVYDMDAATFAISARHLIEAGATIIGGCCGTDPSFTDALRKLIDGLEMPSAPYELETSRCSCTLEASDETKHQYAPRAYAPPPAPAIPYVPGVPCEHSAPGAPCSPFGPSEHLGDFAVCSAQEMVSLEAARSDVLVIGERINPTGRPHLKAALIGNDMDYVMSEAVAQMKAGADIIDVNVGIPGLDEPDLLARCTRELQSCVTAPLQIDSSDPRAIEQSVRQYAGLPIVNSVNGKQESMEAILPIVARYGCSVVGLTLDEDGIPPDAEGRLDIAERIICACESYGIPKSSVLIDCLAVSAAASQDEVREILRAIKLVKGLLGVRCIIGASNISFGLPNRGLANAVFLAAAFGAGLDLAIINPLDARVMDAVRAYRVICGQDRSAQKYISAYFDPQAFPTCAHYAKHGGTASGVESISCGMNAEDELGRKGDGPKAMRECPIAIPEKASASADLVEAVADYVLSGRSAPMADAISKLLETLDPLEIVDDVFIPLLDLVGKRYDEGALFLPQLMSSAEAVKAGFDVLGERSRSLSKDESESCRSKSIVLATVQGDIHDIGKNLVRMLMENYGIDVIDLGKDVAPETIVETVRKNNVKLVGLSALMTTTVKAMEKTIALLRSHVPDVTIIVGGAVLTKEYARSIGADVYAKDAAESARIASRFFKGERIGSNG